MDSQSTVNQSSKKLHPAIYLVMILSLFYWSFIGLTSKMIIIHDAIGYESLGKLLLSGDWQSYLMPAPNREPLYPLFVAFNMKIAQTLQTNYQIIQTIAQILILSLSQWLSAILLKKMKIIDGISIFSMIYIGFSPALVNSSVILYSEILTYPAVLFLILQAAKAWHDFHQASFTRNFFNACGFALAGFFITFIKGGFEIIVPCLLIPYLVLAWQALQTSKKELLIRAGFFFIVSIFIFQIPLITYKLLNKKINGVYALTNRGAFALYGNTAFRMQPLSWDRFKKLVAYTTGPDVCSRIYGDGCQPLGFLQVDIFGSQKVSALAYQGLNGQQINAACARDSAQLALKNPAQYLFLYLLETCRTLFWEAPDIGYIQYPTVITSLYNNSWMRYPLRFTVALLALTSFICGVFYLWHQKKLFSPINQRVDESHCLQLYVLLILFFYIAIHSIFYLTPRYAMAIAPVFLINIAWLCNKLSLRLQTKKQNHSSFH